MLFWCSLRMTLLLSGLYGRSVFLFERPMLSLAQLPMTFLTESRSVIAFHHLATLGLEVMRSPFPTAKSFMP